MEVADLKCLKELEEENRRLKQMYADALGDLTPFEYRWAHQA